MPAISLNQTAARQIASELKLACGRFTLGDWPRLLARCATAACLDTAVAKKNQAVRIGSKLQQTWRRYRDEGFGQSLRHDLQSTKEWAVSVPGRLKSIIERFRSMTRGQQANEVANSLLAWIIFWASAGGADLEGGLPDADLMLGIDDHRNFISHSIFLGLGAEVGLRFAAGLFDEICDRLPPGHSKAWDTSRAFLRANKHRAIVAIWAGIGAHFLKDAALLGTPKPYVWLPGSMPIDAHKALFAANSAASFLMATVPDSHPSR